MIAASRLFRIGFSYLLAASLLLSVIPAPRISSEQAASDSRAVAIVSGFSAGAVALAADNARHRPVERADRASDAALTSAQGWTAPPLVAHLAGPFAPAYLLLDSYLAANLSRPPPSLPRN